MKQSIKLSLIICMGLAGLPVNAMDKVFRAISKNVGHHVVQAGAHVATAHSAVPNTLNKVSERSQASTVVPLHLRATARLGAVPTVRVAPVAKPTQPTTNHGLSVFSAHITHSAVPSAAAPKAQSKVSTSGSATTNATPPAAAPASTSSKGKATARRVLAGQNLQNVDAIADMDFVPSAASTSSTVQKFRKTRNSAFLDAIGDINIELPAQPAAPTPGKPTQQPQVQEPVAAKQQPSASQTKAPKTVNAPQPAQPTVAAQSKKETSTQFKQKSHPKRTTAARKSKFEAVKNADASLKIAVPGAKQPAVVEQKPIPTVNMSMPPVRSGTERQKLENSMDKASEASDTAPLGIQIPVNVEPEVEATKNVAPAVAQPVQTQPRQFETVQDPVRMAEPEVVADNPADVGTAQAAQACAVTSNATVVPTNTKQIRVATKLVDELGKMMSDMFKTAPVNPVHKALKMPNQAPQGVDKSLQQMARLSNTAAQHNLKPCIVGADFMREAFGIDTQVPSVMTDKRNNVIGIVGKKTAQGFVSCLFNEKIVTKVARQMLTAQGHTGKLEGVYRPQMTAGKQVVAAGNSRQQPDIFVFGSKQDAPFMGKIKNFLSGLNTPAFAKTAATFQLPTIAIVQAGANVPQLENIIHKGNPIAPAAGHVQASAAAKATPAKVEVEIDAPKNEQPVKNSTTSTAAAKSKPKRTTTARKSKFDAVKKASEALKSQAPAEPAAQPNKPAVAPGESVKSEIRSTPESVKVDGVKKSGNCVTGQSQIKNTQPAKVERAAPPAPNRPAPKAPVRVDADPLEQNKNTRPTTEPKFNQDNGGRRGTIDPDPLRGERNHRPNLQQDDGDYDLSGFPEMFDEQIPPKAKPSNVSAGSVRGGGGGVPFIPPALNAEPALTKKDGVEDKEKDTDKDTDQNKDKAADKKKESGVNADKTPAHANDADDAHVPSSYNYKPDSNYHPGYDPLNGAAQEKNGEQPTNSYRQPRGAQRPNQGDTAAMSTGAPIIPGDMPTATGQDAQRNGMSLPDTKVGKFDAYGIVLDESNKKNKVHNSAVQQTQIAQHQQAAMQTPAIDELMPAQTTQQSEPAPTTAGILSVIGMILTIIVSSLLRVVFAPFRLF